MEARELRSVLTSHDMFIGGFAGGRGADLRLKDLSNMDIKDANLREAVLTGGRFRNSVLACADLQEVDWDGAAVGGAAFESCKLDDAGRGYLVEHGATVK